MLQALSTPAQSTSHSRWMPPIFPPYSLAEEKQFRFFSIHQARFISKYLIFRHAGCRCLFLLTALEIKMIPTLSTVKRNFSDLALKRKLLDWDIKGELFSQDKKLDYDARRKTNSACITGLRSSGARSTS